MQRQARTHQKNLPERSLGRRLLQCCCMHWARAHVMCPRHRRMHHTRPDSTTPHAHVGVADVSVKEDPLILAADVRVHADIPTSTCPR